MPCKIVSILVVIRMKNAGLALLLLVLLPFLYWFTRTVQKNMLKAQIENRRAVGKASGHVPETLHNIRTIHTLGKERYMEQRYDEYIAESYRAIERTNFYDAIYSPVILILNAVVVAVVMLFSASGNARVLTMFGMSAGTAVAVINYISQIFTRWRAWEWRFRPYSLPLPVYTGSMNSMRWRNCRSMYETKKRPAKMQKLQKKLLLMLQPQILHL